MKKLNYIMAAVTLLALVGTPALLVGCKHGHSDEHRGSHAHQYNCPMHPEYAQESPGSCPKCGMKLTHRY